MRIRNIIFDLDGTLVDTAADLANALSHAVSPYKRGPYGPEEIKPLVGEGLERLIAKVLDPEVLGPGAMEADIETAARWQELLERYDSAENRLTVLVPERFPREASRIAQVLVLGRNTLGSSLSLRKYATWLTQQKRQFRPGAGIRMKSAPCLTVRGGSNGNFTGRVNIGGAGT